MSGCLLCKDSLKICHNSGPTIRSLDCSNQPFITTTSPLAQGRGCGIGERRLAHQELRAHSSDTAARAHTLPDHRLSTVPQPPCYPADNATALSPLPLTTPTSFDSLSPSLAHPPLLLSTAPHHVDVSGGGVFEQKRHAGVAPPRGERRSTGARVQSRDGQRRCFGYQRHRRQKLLLARVQRGHVSVS